MANDGKWMFGATSKTDLNNHELNVKRTYFNRSMPDNYTEGGMQIGNRSTDKSSLSAAAYKAQLDFDKTSNPVSDNIPNAKRRTAYDYNRPVFTEEEHPLGRSSMSALGVPSANYVKPSPTKQALAAQKREELASNRFDIITQMEKDGLPANTPAARNKAELLVGVPLEGTNDDGILEIGQTSEQERSIAKAKAIQYRDQLLADEANFGSPKKSPRSGNRAGYDSMNTDRSFKRIMPLEDSNTYIVSQGPSLDMSRSMKNIQFDEKRRQQAMYREQLANQQATNAHYKTMEAEKNHFDSSVFVPPYMCQNGK